MPPDDPDVLIRKAKQDELVLERLLLDTDVDDDTLGFHAQQSVEKLLKAAMAIRGLDYPRTHDLGTLIDMLAKGGITLPEELADRTGWSGSSAMAWLDPIAAFTRDGHETLTRHPQRTLYR